MGGSESELLFHGTTSQRQAESPLRVEYGRLEYNSAGTAVTLASRAFLYLLCNPLLKHSAAPHFEQSAVPCCQRFQQSHLVSRHDGPGGATSP